MRLSEAMEIVENNNKLEFKGISRYRDEGCYSILSADEGFYEIKNYGEYGYLERNSRSNFNGMINIDMEWELIEQPVTWDEVLKSDKNCKVKHELINEYNFISGELEGLKEFNGLDCIMCILSCGLDSERLKTIIKEGKWYLEN